MPLLAYLQLTASQLSNIQFYEFLRREVQSRRKSRQSGRLYIWQILMCEERKDERKLPLKLLMHY